MLLTGCSLPEKYGQARSELIRYGLPKRDAHRARPIGKGRDCTDQEGAPQARRHQRSPQLDKPPGWRSAWLVRALDFSARAGQTRLLAARRATLTNSLEQADTSRYRDIQATDTTRHRQPDQIVAVFTGQPTHTLALGAHDQDGRPGEVMLIDFLLGLAGRADRPQAALTQLLQRPRQISHSHQRQ